MDNGNLILILFIIFNIDNINLTIIKNVISKI